MLCISIRQFMVSYTTYVFYTSFCSLTCFFFSSLLVSFFLLTGKTRVAALLIATALEQYKCMSDNDRSVGPFRVLGVAHSNGAADVLLEALLELGIPAVRYGRSVY